MADQALLEAFNDCIDHLAAGQNIDECLRRYPQYARTLRPMLESGKLIERTQLPAFEVAAAQMRVRTQVQARLQAPRRRSYIGLRVAAASLVIALLAVFGASENSLPGDPLYGMERFTENIRTDVVGEHFGTRRLDEIRLLMALKRAASVDFSGDVERMEGSRWVVAGLSLQVTADTVGMEGVSTGDQVQVSAETTEQGSLIASAITLLKKVQPPTPTRTPTSTPTVTATATFAPTHRPTVTPQLTPTPFPATSVPSQQQATQKPNTTVSQPPTSLPTPSDDHNGGGQDGGNDSHGGSGSDNSGQGSGDHGGTDGHGGSAGSSDGGGSSGGGSSGGTG